MDARDFARAAEGLRQQFPFVVGDDALAISTRFRDRNQHASYRAVKQRVQSPSFYSRSAIRNVCARQGLSGPSVSSAQGPNDIARKKMDELHLWRSPYGCLSAGRRTP